MKASEMEWREIKTAGKTFPPEHLNAAWAEWLRRMGDSYQPLWVILERVTGDEAGCDRTADKMLQRARRAGVIRWNGKTWDVVEDAE